MLMKNRKKIIVAILMLSFFCLIPVRSPLNDGGTVIYSAVLYKIIVWHQINLNARVFTNSNGKQIDNNEPEFLTGTYFYIFPMNFGDKEYTK